MNGLISAAGYVPYHRLRRDAIPRQVGGGSGRGTRAVASHDEDATTLAVAAGRIVLADGGVAPGALVFATATPAYLDKTNATAIHAALRLDRHVRAADAGGAPRSAIGALLTALDGTTPTLVTAADVRTGRPGSPDETETGDAGAAILVGDSDDVIAEVLGQASTTEEFLDRYRPPGEDLTTRWEERFGETRYVPLAQEAYDAALKSAGLVADDVDHLIVTGLHGRAVKRAARAMDNGRDVLVDDLTGAVGNTGTPHAFLLLADVLEHAEPGRVIVVVSMADGCDVLVLRTTPAVTGHRRDRDVRAQVESGRDDLDYLRFLSWRGQLTPEPPRRPSPARASAPAAARNADWKFGFVGSRDESTQALHLPPARVSWDGGAVDQMVPAPMADRTATIVTFTVDHLAWSPSPPTVFAVLDFEGGGRYACALTDVDADELSIGDRVEMTFRRLGDADGVVNYFWKARPAFAPPASGNAEEA